MFWSFGWVRSRIALLTMLGFMVAGAALAAPAYADTPPAASDAASAFAAVAEAAPSVADQIAELKAAQASNARIANTVWVLIAGMLVFFMNAGFGMLETGLCRRKNAVHILAKNFIVFAVSSVAFWVVGFGLMFGEGTGYTTMVDGEEVATTFIGTTGFASSFMITEGDPFPGLSWADVPFAVKFFFQLVFAGTAATIVSGCVAERTKFGSFMIFSFVLVAIAYPLTGHWVWGGGWLAGYGLHDFAGSTVVHSVGGWAGLAGILIIGPRLGKYRADGSVNPIPGHNLSIAALGTLILWLGWFGFNPGSTMTANEAIGHIAVTTNMAAALGAIAATITAWAVLGKPDLSMILNGCLAGLVAITAPCAVVPVWAAAVIGLIAGVLVVLAVLFFDKLKIDDPVGALSVHLVNGIWGTLAVGIFASEEVSKAIAGVAVVASASQFIAQLVGVLAVGATTLGLSLVVWTVLKFTIGVRVSAAEEVDGLDVGEHGMEAYPGFSTDTSGAAESAALAEAGLSGKTRTALA